MPMIEGTFLYQKKDLVLAYGAAWLAFRVLHGRKSILLTLGKVRHLGLGFVALVSYPLYVIHPEILHVLRSQFRTPEPTVVLCALLALSYLLHIAIEAPFIALGKRATRSSPLEASRSESPTVPAP